MRIKRMKKRARLRLTTLIVGAVLLCVIIILMLFTAGRAFSNSAFIGAMVSGQFRMFLTVACASAVGLAVLSAVLVRAGRGQKKLARQDGTAILEFAMVLPIMLILALLMIQSSLLMGSYLCVNYAAFCSARSAAVYVPANLSGYYDYERLADDVEGPNNINVYQPSRSVKMDHIRSAAIWAVMPVSNGSYDDESASRAEVLIEGLDEFFRLNSQAPPRWAGEYLGRKLAYAERYTHVTLTDDNGENIALQAGGSGFYRYQEHEDIHVTVAHNLYLSVPYAGWLLWQLDGADDEGNLGNGRYALPVRVSSTLPNEGVGDTIDTEVFPSDD